MSEVPTYTIKSIVIDTLNAIQNAQYAKLLEKKGKATHDDWTDYGVDIYLFMERLKELGFENILILGKEGSGKSYGMKTLAPGEYVWYNADKKNPTFTRTPEHFKLYGTKTNPGLLMKLPTDYDEIVKSATDLKKGITTPNFSIKLDKAPVAFIIGHTEEYRNSNGGMNQRLRVLGKLATKMQIEGQVEQCFYSEVSIEDNKPKGYFRTAGDGNDTCRTSEGLFSSIRIPNDFQNILNSLEAQNAMLSSM